MYQPNLFDKVNRMLAPPKVRLLELGQKKLNFGDSEVMLEVGCGPGYVSTAVLLPKITAHLQQLVATDVNKGMIKTAKEKYSHPQITYKVLDFSEKITEDKKHWLLPKGFPSIGFDKIFSFNCLMLVKDQRLVARNLYSLLKPGGESLIILCARSLDFEIYRVLSKNTKWEKYLEDVENIISPYQDSEDPSGDFRRYFQSAGLQVTGCETELVKIDCRDPTDARDLLTALNVFLERIPPELREQYTDDCISVWKQLRDPDDLHFDYFAIIANISKPV